MKSEMINILSNSDRFDRFISEHQKLMKEAAAGLAILAHWRFNKIVDSIQAQAKEVRDSEA